jgi:hypothetical protein
MLIEKQNKIRCEVKWGASGLIQSMTPSVIDPG